MTIALGVLCQDGIVLAADTEHTGSIKLPGPKVWAMANGDTVQNADVRLGLAGAGDSVLLRSARDKIAHRLSHDVRTADDAVDAVEAQLIALFGKHVYPFPNFSENRQLSLILGLHDATGCRLYENSTTALARVDFHVCAGWGADLGNYLLQTLIGEKFMPFVGVVGIAVYTLMQVKQYSPYCGGNSHVLIINNSGGMGYVSDDGIAQMESGFRGFDLPSFAFRDRAYTEAIKWFDKPPVVSPTSLGQLDAPSLLSATAAGLRVSGISAAGSACPVAS
jgi:hypothetical protein